MKTISIKGNDYIPVNERLIYFRSNGKYKDWQIKEKIVSIDDKEAIFKVIICDNKGIEIATAHSQEYRDSSYINKTSFVENGFTSALGRALGYLGIGIDTSIASADEVDNAVKNQSDKKDKSEKNIEVVSKKWLTESQFVATINATDEQAKKVLDTFKMKKEYRSKIKEKFNLI